MQIWDYCKGHESKTSKWRSLSWPHESKAIAEMPQSTDKKAVKRLLGCVNYLSRSLPKWLLLHWEHWAPFCWESQQQSFEQVKKLVTTTSVLKFYNTKERSDHSEWPEKQPCYIMGNRSCLCPGFEQKFWVPGHKFWNCSILSQKISSVGVGTRSCLYCIVIKTEATVILS